MDNIEGPWTQQPWIYLGTWKGQAVHTTDPVIAEIFKWFEERLKQERELHQHTLDVFAPKP